ncbi:hypothetical protein FALCPG4_016192 [Fusarium falciforme]
MSRACRVSHSEWERNKEHIRALYLDQDKSLDDLVTSMAKRHGFHASKAQYIRKLGTWNMKKYSSKEAWKHADALVRKRKVDGKDTEIIMNGKLVSAKKLKKELGRYAWQRTHGQQSLAGDAPPVVARTPPSFAMPFIQGRTIPWFQFQDRLHSLMARNLTMVPNLELDLSPSGNQVGLLPFVNDVLMPRSSAKTLSDVVSAIQDQMPRAPDFDATAQVGRCGPDHGSLALQWALYRCTNNLLRPRQIDELLDVISSSGNLAVLKGICRLSVPTTRILLSKLLPSAIRLRDLALADFLLEQGADREASYSRDPSFTILQAAANDHKDDVVQLLLEHRANPSHANADGETPLHLALTRPGGLSTARLLVQAGADLNPPSRGRCRSPLMRAVANGGKDTVRLLIKAGADVNFSLPSGDSALQIAVDARDVKMVRVLLNAGADPNLGADLRLSLPLHGIGNPSRLPLGAVAASTGVGSNFSETFEQRGRRRKIIDMLLQAGASVNAIPPFSSQGCAETAMQAAARSGDFDICSLFIFRGGDIRAPAIGEWGMTCLQAAAFSGNFELVLFLLGVGADINEATSKPGWTVLQAAASSGNIELVNLFLHMGANVNHQSPMTALEVAVDNRHIPVVRRLLDAGADINQIGRLGPALFSAARNQDAQLFDLLMAQGADPDPPNCYVSPLMVAIHEEWVHGARLLIQAGADVNKPCTKPTSYDLPQHLDWDWDLTVPLVAAVMTDDVEFVQMLLDAGARLDGQTSRCLDLAVRSRSGDIVQLLLQYGANPNQISLGSKAVAPIHAAVMAEDWSVDTEVLATLIAFGANVNASSGEGYPLEIITNAISDMSLHPSERHGFVEARDLLLQAGANPGLFNHKHSKLQYAVKKGDIARVQSFISSGEDLNEPANDNGGATALQYAAIHGHFNIAMLLIENGAHINAPGAKIHGRTALQGAAENGRLDIVHLLLECDDEPDLLEERRHDAAGYAEEEGHRVIAQILREWKRS